MTYASVAEVAERMHAPLLLAAANVVGSAVFSSDRRYRYSLSRRWSDDAGCCVWVMLNPSSADATNDDPTIRKCIGFAKRWGFGAIEVVNLFALVSTDPKGLLDAEDPVGPLNDKAIDFAMRGARRVVLAWGSHDAAVRRLVASRIGAVVSVSGIPGALTLGRTADGSPRHPSRIAYSTPVAP